MQTRPKSFRLRKFAARLTGLSVVFLALTVVTEPLWIVPTLKFAAGKSGVTMEKGRSLGYGKLQLQGVRYENKSLLLHVREMTMLQPGPWLWNLRTKADAEMPNIVSLKGFSITLLKSGAADSTNSMFETVQELDKSIDFLQRWLPVFSFSDGSLEFQNRRLEIVSGEYRNRTLHVASGDLNPLGVVVLSGIWGTGRRAVIVELPDLQSKAEVELRMTAGRLLAFAEIQWVTNRFVSELEFSRKSQIPVSGFFRGPQQLISGGVLRLEGVRNLVHQVDAVLDKGEMRVSLKGSVEPEEESLLSDLSYEISGRAITNQVELTTFNLSAPWLEAVLSNPVILFGANSPSTNHTVLDVKTDLEKQSLIPMRGRLDGTASFMPGTNRIPDIEIRIFGANIAVAGMDFPRLKAGGFIRWPNLDLESVTVQTEPAGEASAKGRINFASSRISSGELAFQGTSPLWWSNQPPPRVDLKVGFSGRFGEVSHQGILVLTNGTLGVLTNLHLTAAWSGTNVVDGSLKVELQDANHRRLAVEGTVSSIDQSFAVNLQKLEFDPGVSADPLKLARPTSMAMKSREGTTLFFVNDLNLTGSNSSFHADINMDWPAAGHFISGGSNLSSEILEIFQGPLPWKGQVRNFQIQGAVTNGFLTAKSEGQIGLDYLTNQFQARYGFELDARGIRKMDLRLSSFEQPFLEVFLKLPLSLQLNHPDLVRFPADGELLASIHSLPNNEFWNSLGQFSRLKISDPQFQCSVTGSMAFPKGFFEIKAREISLGNWFTNTLPVFSGLELKGIFSGTNLSIHRAQISLDGEPVVMEANFPLTLSREARSWRDLMDISQTSGKLDIDRFPIGKFAPYISPLIASQGVLDAELALHPGLKPSARISLTGAATRPVMPFGSFQEINGRFLVQDQLLTIEGLEAQMSGEPIQISGSIDFDPKKKTNGYPQMLLSVLGKNLPVVRQPDFLLRGDLDLKLKNQESGIPTVFGSLALKNGFLTRDLKLLAPTGISKPSQRPPYFSLETDPFAEWGLDVRLYGEQFLRIKTPLFGGTASAAMVLAGTLKEPLALGEIRVDSGQIIFPFANIHIQQGLVSLSTDNPYVPQLFFSGESRAYGYDVKMLVTGSADQPRIEFTSTPGLSSEQILLMVSAGELPKKELTFSASEKATQLGMYLGRDLLNRFSDDQGGAERLTIQSGEYVSQEGRPTYGIEYRLNDRWSLIGEYDRFNALNAGVKWKVYSK